MRPGASLSTASTAGIRMALLLLLLLVWVLSALPSPAAAPPAPELEAPPPALPLPLLLPVRRGRSEPVEHAERADPVIHFPRAPMPHRTARWSQTRGTRGLRGSLIARDRSDGWWLSIACASLQVFEGRRGSGCAAGSVPSSKPAGRMAAGAGQPRRLWLSGINMTLPTSTDRIKQSCSGVFDSFLRDNASITSDVSDPGAAWDVSGTPGGSPRALTAREQRGGSESQAGSRTLGAGVRAHSCDCGADLRSHSWRRRRCCGAAGRAAAAPAPGAPPPDRRRPRRRRRRWRLRCLRWRP